MQSGDGHAKSHDGWVRAGGQPDCGVDYFIANVGQGKLLDADSGSARVFREREGDDLASMAGLRAERLRWRLLPCPHEAEVVYIVNIASHAFLDSHGEDVTMMDANEMSFEERIAKNTSRYAQNIRWYVLPCPHQAGTFYVINRAYRKFLDTHGKGVALWNNNGNTIETVVAENISVHAGNLRWRFAVADATLASPLVASVDEIRIVHISDTHSMHRDIESQFRLPEGDILIHTGDFSNHGTDAEIKDFDQWLGEVGRRYRFGALLIPGNHDLWGTIRAVSSGTLDPKLAVAPQYFQQRFRHCRVLEHEEVTVAGFRIFGSGWCPWQKDGSPDKVGGSEGHAMTATAWTEAGGNLDQFNAIPDGVDVLLTHCPARNILDCTGQRGYGWGSSTKLRDAIYRTRPRIHLFGHLHEQRGLYVKGRDGGYSGGVEYSITKGGKPFTTTGPPPDDYPCELVSCNAMSNHAGLEHSDFMSIAGPPRVVVLARRQRRAL